ncbi:metallophosphoesterase family protein [Candidatus Omnitrophota bacterium]
MSIIKHKYSKLKDIKTIAILADPACRKGWERNFPRLLNNVRKRYSPDLFIVAGDLALHGYDKEYRTILKYINLKDNEKWVAVPGDHDKSIKNFRKYFGSTRKVVDVGKWRFIGANTANKMFLKREAEWIDSNMRKNSIIFSHIPPEAEGWTFHSLWPRSSSRFLALIKKHKKNVKGMYFGHIHGFTERKFLNIPMTVSGAVAESKIVKNNRYGGKGTFKVSLFFPDSGKTRTFSAK